MAKYRLHADLQSSTRLVSSSPVPSFYLSRDRLVPLTSKLQLVRLDTSNIKIVTELVDWPRTVRRASINSFGYGGKFPISWNRLGVSINKQDVG